MRGKYKNKKLIKDNGNDEINTEKSFIEVPVEVYEKDIRTRAAIRRAITPIVIFGLILFVGVFLIIYGAKPSLFRDKSFVPTQATIVKYEWRYNPPSYFGSSYHPSHWSPHPVFNYVYDGKEYTVESRVAVYPIPYEVGEKITIYVNPSNPTDVVSPIADQMYIYIGIGIIVASVLALCILALYPILKAKYPTSHWHKFLTLYIPSMIFLWGIVILYCVSSSGFSKDNIEAIILLVFLIAVAGFISTIMIKDMIMTIRDYVKQKASGHNKKS
ncbi:MAG: DUF3592 domain-containing protein [Clostridia bacterium]|nr:DUF3592 domain-containing protein [Clostridia bacterium]